MGCLAIKSLSLLIYCSLKVFKGEIVAVSSLVDAMERGRSSYSWNYDCYLLGDNMPNMLRCLISPLLNFLTIRESRSLCLDESNEGLSIALEDC